MDCGAFDIGCQTAAFFAPIIFWAKVIFGCVAAVLVAAVLLWAYRKAGWWGVGIVLSFGAAALIFKSGVDFGDKWHRKDPEQRHSPDPDKPLQPDLDEFLKDLFNGNRRKKR